MRRLRPRATLLASLAAAGLACQPLVPAVPLDRPVFPTGLALAPDGAHLFVVSSTFDSSFPDGALLATDLSVVRRATAGGNPDTVVTDAFADGLALPLFGDKPVFTPSGSRLYVPTRGDNVVSAVDVDGAAMSCTGAERCGASPAALQLPENDPFEILITGETTTDGKAARVDGLVTLLSSPTVFFFRDDLARPGAQRIQEVGRLGLGDAIGGVRSAVLRPADARDALVVAAGELSRQAGLVGAQLLAFAPRTDASIASVDVTAVTGALGIRDVVLVEGDDGAVGGAVLVALRTPDAIGRFELDDDDGGSARFRLTGLSSTCRAPTSLATTTTAAGPRVLVTCQDDDAVLALEPRTLAVTDAVRFYGRSPYDVVAAGDEVFVSFFLDNSVGALAFVDDGSGPRLTARGHVGAPLPRPEDGRE
jgi:hypothetical protein